MKIPVTENASSERFFIHTAFDTLRCVACATYSILHCVPWQERAQFSGKRQCKCCCETLMRQCRKPARIDQIARAAAAAVM